MIQNLDNTMKNEKSPFFHKSRTSQKSPQKMKFAGDRYIFTKKKFNFYFLNRQEMENQPTFEQMNYDSPQKKSHCSKPLRSPVSIKLQRKVMKKKRSIELRFRNGTSGARRELFR